MKDIQVDVYNILQNISEIDESYTSRPPVIFEENQDVVVVFYEIENEPGLFTDGLEEVSLITYNFDIYSKSANTYAIRELIDTELNKYGFVRITGGTEFRIDDYYQRLLSYTIKK